MAALQTNTLIDGVWTGQTVDLRAVLEHHQRQEARAVELPAVLRHDPPDLGIICQTIIESPVIRWILPCRLRSLRHNDVAFVGDAVYMRELRADGHLLDVARMTNVGVRIVHATVITTSPDFRAGSSSSRATSADTTSTDDGDAVESPQCLVLAVEDGYLAFVRAIDTVHGVTFAVTCHDFAPSPMRSLSTAQLAVDPTSRYLAVAGAPGLFALCALRPQSEYAELRHPYPNPVIDTRYIDVDGLIHKIDFLFPAPDDPDHVILLLLVIKGGSSRLLVFEWEAGRDLNSILPHSRKGHPLPEKFRVPLLLIPLRLHSAFLLVGETSIAHYKDILLGSPIADVVDLDIDPPTELYVGAHQPLWSAWARPMRMDHYTSRHDDLYIAREDGVVKFLETEESDIGPYMSIGSLQCAVGTAFASVDPGIRTPRRMGDLLIAGADTCNGGMYEVRARKVAAFIEPIYNWSPTIDFTTVSSTGPDKIYASAGKGRNGSVAELRIGVEARIGFDIDYETPIHACWAFPSSLYRVAASDAKCMLFLISLGSHSALLHLSDDGTVSEVDQSCTPLDLSSQTLAAAAVDEYSVQVTDTAVRVMRGALAAEDADLAQAESFTMGPVLRAAISSNGLVVVCTDSDLHVIDVTGAPQPRGLHPLSHPTCLGLFEVNGQLYAACGVKHQLIVYRVDQSGVTKMGEYQSDGRSRAEPADRKEAFSGVVALTEPSGPDMLLLVAQRNGKVVSLQVDEWTLEVHDRCSFGTTAVTLFADGPHAAFACCEGSTQRITLKNRGDRTRPTLSIQRVWLTDAADLAMLQPRAPLNAIARSENDSLLFAVGSRLLVVDFDDLPKGIPRHVRLGGSPTRIIYSHTLKCLVVGLTKENRTSLHFIDEETGEDISRPVDRHGAPADYVSGMGREGERILGLIEWAAEDEKPGWHFIVVSTSAGRINFMSAARDSGGISFCTKNKRREASPVYSMVGSARGIFFCVGTSLQWETLDVGERRFKKVCHMDLPSAAVSMRLQGNTLCVVTRRHSLVAMRLSPAGAAVQTLTPLFTDEVYRTGLHQTAARTDVTILSDADGTVTGLWSPLLSDESLTCTAPGVARPVFEAELSSSIIRLQQGHTRPLWRCHDAAPPAQILGISIHGSLRALTIVDAPVLHLLRFVEDMAQTSPLYAPLTHDQAPDADADRSSRRRWVDGDILRRVVDHGGLGALLWADRWRRPHRCALPAADDDFDEKHVHDIEDRFAQLVRDAHGAAPADTLQTAYEILDDVLQPVL